MRRRWIAGAAMMLVQIAFARQGVVVTNDGRRIEGEISEKTDYYVVNLHGVEMSIAKGDVNNVTYPDAYNKEFADRLVKLDANDVNGRIALAREAFNRRQYGLAREALDDAQRIDPNNREAADLQNTISSQLRLEQHLGAEDAKAMPTPPPQPTGSERRLLSASDINIIRQNELQSGDHVNVQFSNGVEKRFMKFRNLQFNDFNALKPVDRALKILEDGDETMRSDVKILNDPSSIVEYRQKIQPLVMNGCAASNCHGGPKGGDLILYNPSDTDAVLYTDLYILLRYRKKINEGHPSSAIFEAPERQLVDRGQGARSLLAQFGLPADISDIDHPQVMGYDFVFRNMDDLRFKQVVEWMNVSLKEPAADYSSIKYTPPVAPTTQPTAPMQGPMLAPKSTPAKRK